MQIILRIHAFMVCALKIAVAMVFATLLMLYARAVQGSLAMIAAHNVLLLVVAIV